MDNSIGSLECFHGINSWQEQMSSLLGIGVHFRCSAKGEAVFKGQQMHLEGRQIKLEGQ